MLTMQSEKFAHNENQTLNSRPKHSIVDSLENKATKQVSINLKKHN